MEPSLVLDGRSRGRRAAQTRRRLLDATAELLAAVDPDAEEPVSAAATNVDVSARRMRERVDVPCGVVGGRVERGSVRSSGGP
jgi:hypothetical protein